MTHRKVSAFGFFVFLLFTAIACRQAPAEPPTLAAGTVKQLPTIEGARNNSSSQPGLEPSYRDENQLPAVVDVSISSASPEPASVQMPAYIETEIAGFNLATVDRLVGRHEADGRLKLISLEMVYYPSSNLTVNSWPDGAHALTEVWYAEGFYLTDGIVGDFPVLWSSHPESNLRTINGLYKNAGQIKGQDLAQEVILTIDLAGGLSDDLILAENGSQIVPGEGDTFQLTEMLLEDGGNLKPVPGIILTFNDSGNLLLDKRPLPSGDYFFGFMAQTEDGTTSAAYANFLVRNDTVQPDLRAYYDPEAGFQFLFPSSWQEPKIESNRLSTSNISDTVRLMITTHPDLVNKPAEELAAAVLQNFGEVQILYEDKVSLGSSGALRIIYGYDADDGAHTGVFISFVMDELAYVIDIDGKSELESTVLNNMETIASSFVSRPSQVGRNTGNWQVMKLNDFTMSVPANYRLASLENGWHRLDSADGSGFIALRVETGSESIQDRLDHWQSAAANEVEEFAFSKSYGVRIGNRAWQRIDFNYDHEEAGVIYGNLMIANIDDGLLTAWTEAEIENYTDVDGDILSIILASVKTSD